MGTITWFIERFPIYPIRADVSGVPRQHAQLGGNLVTRGCEPPALTRTISLASLALKDITTFTAPLSRSIGRGPRHNRQVQRGAVGTEERDDMVWERLARRHLPRSEERR